MKSDFKLFLPIFTAINTVAAVTAIAAVAAFFYFIRYSFVFVAVLM